jgi:hypothetical protein
LSDSYKIYRTIHSSLQKFWDFEPSKRQNNSLNILTGFICGIIQSKSVKLAHVAGEIPGSGKEESRIMQLRRWLKNEKVGVDLFYFYSFSDTPLLLYTFSISLSIETG